MELTKEKFYEVASSLEHKHALFYQLWELGTPEFTKEISTAAVSFDEEGSCIKFLFNPDFWNSLGDETRLFVIGHECLHVILNHGVRAKKAMGSSNPTIMKALNISMDIVVNSLLTRSFGFNRDNLDPILSEGGCWVDTVFPNNIYPDDKHFEFYYRKITQEIKRLKKACGPEGNWEFPFPLDDHDQMAHIPPEVLEESLEDIARSLSDQEIEGFNEKVKNFKENTGGGSAGIQGGSGVLTIPKNYVKKNKSWESVTKKWIRNKMKIKTREQWIKESRRHSLLGRDLYYPSEIEVETLGHKIDVWFFLDTSGSCKRYAQRFFKAAETVPSTHFNLRIFCFDTKVYETSLESRRLYGFGGTRFDVIEKDIQTRIDKEGVKYPSSVFLITDGHGNKVSPEYPKRWHWFMTSRNTLRYIPKDSFIGNLSEYE